MHLPKVPEHHGSRKNHGGWVSPVCSHNITSDMSAARLEKSVLLSACQRMLVLQWGMCGSKRTVPTLHPGTIPGPPTSAAPILETMAP
jgi:hypothetical protein